MKPQQLADLISQMGAALDPPGGMSTFVAHPTAPRRSVEIALVFEHRFAFVYWLKWQAARAANELAPDLVTIDWHNDIGGKCDFVATELKQLNLQDGNEVALFAWARLRPLNDGHVAPALYLKTISSVHAIIKQDWDRWVRARDLNYQVADSDGNPHRVRFYRSLSTCARALAKDEEHRPIVLDIDLDYFTRRHSSNDRDRQIAQPDELIARILAPSTPFMQEILPRLFGMTIALEPDYCGGLGNSLHILDVVGKTLFGGKGLATGAHWRHGRT